MSVSSDFELPMIMRRTFSDRWIVNQFYDLFFFIGSCLLTLAFWALYQVARHFHMVLQGDSILITYFIFTTFFDHPHIFQTFSRTHFDPIEFKKHQILHTWGIAILILIGFGAITLNRESELIVFASFLGTYHIIRQHYGFLKAYKNLNQDRFWLDDWLDFGTFNLGMFACFFNDYTDLGGSVVIYQDLKSNFPEFPSVLVEVIWNAFLGFLLLFIARQIYRLIQGKPINLPKLLLMAATLSTHYFVFFATATPFLVAEALETAYHNVQYHGWMMYYQKRRFPQIKHVAVKWLAIALLYGGIAGSIEILGLMHRDVWMWLFIPFTMVIIYHYYVDGIIWKFSQQLELRPILFGRDLGKD